MKTNYKPNNRPNDLTREINDKLRQVQPSLRLIGKWREEWVATGADHRMIFQDYKRIKCGQWHRARAAKKVKT